MKNEILFQYQVNKILDSYNEGKINSEQLTDVLNVLNYDFGNEFETEKINIEIQPIEEIAITEKVVEKPKVSILKMASFGFILSFIVTRIIFKS